MPIVKFEGPDGPEEHTLLMGSNGLPRLMLPEVREIQRVTGIGMTEFAQALDRYDGDAWAMLIVCLWKRKGKIARIDDVEVDIGSIALELLPEEQAAAEKSESGAGADEADPTQAGASSGAPTEAG